MDWRNRKYFVAFFHYDQNWHIKELADNPYCKVHPYVYPPKADINQLGHNTFKDKFIDEREPRGYYQVLVGCREEYSDDVEAYLATTPCCVYKEVFPL